MGLAQSQGKYIGFASGNVKSIEEEAAQDLRRTFACLTRAVRLDRYPATRR